MDKANGQCPQPADEQLRILMERVRADAQAMTAREEGMVGMFAVRVDQIAEAYAEELEQPDLSAAFAEYACREFGVPRTV